MKTKNADTAAIATPPKRKATRPVDEPNFFVLAMQGLVKGDIWVKLSALIMGAGYVGRKQYAKGVIITALEAAFFWFVGAVASPYLAKFGTLGTVKMEMVFDAATMKNVVNNYDNSFQILLISVIALVGVGLFVVLWLLNLSNVYRLQLSNERGEHVETFVEEVKSYFNERFHLTLLSLPVLGVLVFTVVPLFIMIAIAFTNYDQLHMPPNDLFSWVGFTNFKSLFTNSLSVTFGYAFGKVLSWTLVWAFFATFTNYFGGIMLAKFLNNKKTKWPALWRTLFVVTIAVPQFVTLLLVRNFFANNGIANTFAAQSGLTAFLQTIGLVSESSTFIPFLTSPGWAKFMLIIINIWIGVPYQMLVATGVLLNIPADMTESAKLDGANEMQIFWNITMPYMFAVTGPQLVTDFVKNINNFNVIYLLTQDVFQTHDQAMAMSNAKEIDLLVTWLFRLTQDYYNYKMASVIGIFVFIICAVFTLISFGYLTRGDKESTFQ